MSQTPGSILHRAISVYSLPPELLNCLAVRSIQADNEPAPPQEEPEAPAAAVASSTGLRCQACPGASFDTPEEQRAHFKSDWHRYNAKAKLQGTAKAVPAEEWDKLADGVSSISGSASSSSGSSQGSKITRLLNKTKVADTVDSDEEAELADLRRRAQLRTAVIWFKAQDPPASLGIPADTQLGVHRALLSASDTAADYLADLRNIQLGAPLPDDEERRIALFMVAGGHFAGMIVSLRPRGPRDRQEVKGAGDVRVLKHKTFHRYTTRRKQGGSQALNDNSKSKAVSAGAMLRRYGEQALQEEIRALLVEWADDIALSERIFLRASTHGKHSFWGYDGAILDRADPRIRSFPFPTRRPTQQELLRCWHELTRVKVSHLSAEALAAQDEAYIASLQPRKTKPTPTVQAPTPAPAPAKPKLSPEEEARLDRARRLTDMVQKGRMEPLRAFVARYADEVEPPLLGVAAAAGQEEVLRFLLLESRLDPTTALDGGKRAYDLSSSKGVRNVFRRVAFDHPSMWDWQAARVPSGLSEEAEAEQGARKAERRRGLREKMREKQAAREAAGGGEQEEEVEQARPEPFGSLGLPPSSGGGGPQRLGGRPGAAEGLAGLSADMRMQIERERRARAAEARFKS